MLTGTFILASGIIKLVVDGDFLNSKKTPAPPAPTAPLIPIEKENTSKPLDDNLLLKNVPGCSTAGKTTGLDRQILTEMIRIEPNILVSFNSPDVKLTNNSVLPYLQPPAKEALEKAIEERGKTMKVNCAYRSITQQQLLFNWGRSCGYNVVARPNRSNHQSGLAIDLVDYAGWKPYLEKYGWRWYGNQDKVHFDYVGNEVKDIRTTHMAAFQKLWNLFNPDDLIDDSGIYGSETAERLNNSPVNGFNPIR